VISTSTSRSCAETVAGGGGGLDEHGRASWVSLVVHGNSTCAAPRRYVPLAGSCSCSTGSTMCEGTSSTVRTLYKILKDPPGVPDLY